MNDICQSLESLGKIILVISVRACAAGRFGPLPHYYVCTPALKRKKKIKRIFIRTFESSRFHTLAHLLEM